MPANVPGQQGEGDRPALRNQPPWQYDDDDSQGTWGGDAYRPSPWERDAYRPSPWERDPYRLSTLGRNADGLGGGERDTGGQGNGQRGADDADGHDTGQRRARHVSPIRVIRRPWAAVAALAGLIVVCAGAGGLVWASHTARPATPLGRAPFVPIPAGHYAAAPAAVAVAVPAPTALEIPAIGVRTRLIRLGVTATGALQVPASIAVAGWYTGSSRPGATGSAVIAGHIDSVSGPGVFFRLRELHPGDLVYVRRGHASMAVFTVTAVRLVPKSNFPTDEVYGPVPNAQLRLITCGGTFDPATGHYLSNVIVFAVLQ
jgi:LPXTG-site transpeptidase (sortase) family protein